MASGGIVDQRLAASNETVKNGAFADIRTAYNGNLDVLLEEAAAVVAVKFS